MKELANRILDVPEKVMMWSANTIWVVAEHVFKLMAWGLACGLLVAIAHKTKTADPKILWTVYALLLLWVATFFSACVKVVVAAQDQVFESRQRAPKWVALFLLVIVTGGGLLAIATIGPAVLLLFTTVLTSNIQQ